MNKKNNNFLKTSIVARKMDDDLKSKKKRKMKISLDDEENLE